MIHITNPFLDQYLNEIGRIPCLTPHEERALAARIQRKDKKAVEEMIQANLRLVVSLTKKYAEFDVEITDLIGEGNIALIKSAQGFKLGFGTFASYAGVAILRQMRRCVHLSRTVRIPVKAAMRLATIKKAERRHQSQERRAPSDLALAYEMKLSVWSVRRVKKADLQVATPRATHREDGMNSTSVLDGFEDMKTVRPDHALMNRDSRMYLGRMLAQLSWKERTILTHRFELGGAKKITLADLGKSMGVSRESVRLFQNEAISRLRRRHNLSELSGNFERFNLNSTSRRS